MGVLRLFGDSFTEGHLLDLTFPRYKEWKEFRGGNLPLCWGDLLSSKLNMRMSNHAIGGMSNVEIFHTICRHSSEFEKEDIVIINWAYPNRFRWIRWSDEQQKYIWTRMGANPMDGTIISEKTRNDIAMNRILPPAIEEVYEYERIITEYAKCKKFKLFFWSADVDIINNLPSESLNKREYILSNYIDKLPLDLRGRDAIGIARSEMKRTIFDVFHEFGAETIMEETNGWVTDNHLGEKGHIIQYELFYNYIVSNNLI
jgi:hypothetical protein